MNTVLKIILLIMLTSGILVSGCFTPIEQVEAPQIGNLAPSFQLQNLEGQTVSLSDLRNKPVLINFWATRCSWCVVEMPYIQEIYEEWADKGLVVLAINTGESSSRVESFLQKQGLSLPVLLDADLLVALRYDVMRYNKLYIPTTFFVDKDGILQATKIGAFRDKAEIEISLSKIIP